MAPARQGDKTIKPIEIAKKARKALEEKQGKDIVLFDMRGLSEITDFFLVVSGTSGPQLKALFNSAQVALKAEGVQVFRRAGDPDSGWIVLDFVDVVIHIFLDETRKFYQIEDLWREAPRVP